MYKPLPPVSGAPSTSSSSTPRTCRPTRSRPCRPRRGSMRRASRSTGPGRARRAPPRRGRGVGVARPGGHLLIETSERQAPVAVDLFERAGLVARTASDDDLGATVVIGEKPR
ncbi:hypothetical protein NKG05_08030 [Oerskovia sp. M15]